jgi:hypothetical protein
VKRAEGAVNRVAETVSAPFQRPSGSKARPKASAKRKTVARKPKRASKAKKKR